MGRRWGIAIYVVSSSHFVGLSPVTAQLFLELFIIDINIDHSELTILFIGIWSEQPLFGAVLAIYIRRML